MQPRWNSYTNTQIDAHSVSEHTRTCTCTPLLTMRMRALILASCCHDTEEAYGNRGGCMKEAGEEDEDHSYIDI